MDPLETSEVGRYAVRTPVAVGAFRCPSCGMHQSMGPEKPNPFTAANLGALAALLAGVYAITLVVVAAAR